MSSRWGVQFPIEKVSFPSGLSHLQQLARFIRFNERTLRPELPSVSLGPHI